MNKQQFSLLLQSSAETNKSFLKATGAEFKKKKTQKIPKTTKTKNKQKNPTQNPNLTFFKSISLDKSNLKVFLQNSKSHILTFSKQCIAPSESFLYCSGYDFSCSFR